MKMFLRVLLPFSCGLLLLASCSQSPLKGFVRKLQPEYAFTPVFDKEFEKSLYAVNLTLEAKSLTGIAIIKQIEKKRSFRMVYMAETGLKYFDIEFFPGDSSVVHYMMDALNYKKIVSLITSDFGLIFKTSMNEFKTSYYKSQNPAAGFVFRYNNKGKRYFYFSQESQPPYKIIHQSFLSEPKVTEISYDAKKLPTEIKISHGKSKAKVELEIIPKR